MDGNSSARLGLPYLAAAQLQKHVTLNEALTRLDALVQTGVVSRTVAAQPASPADGNLYILPAGATGAAWTARAAGDLMRAEAGGWALVPVSDGAIARVADDDQVVVRREGAWTPLGEALGALQNVALLGLGATADAANPFTARLNKALWTARETGDGGDGDLRFTFNKQASGDVLSLLFQSGFGGRAELGLIGDDDLTLKVSADGASWSDALAIDRTDGRVWFARGAARAETTDLTSGGYIVPAWARLVEIVCVGGGGGGGAGAVGAAGTVRHGGGGGGAGGISTALWSTADLGGNLTITVGAAGTGGAGVAGEAGGDSTVTSDGALVLTGPRGSGGAVGGSVSGRGGAGGAGSPAANRGGESSVTTAGLPGEALSRPDGSGGGGGGGGLDAANTARSGGAGGAGACLRALANGGTGGTGAGGNGGWTSPKPALSWAGGGGGGGGASASGSGHSGGVGAAYGAGGGGGGAGSGGWGGGGAGAPGLVRLTAIG